MPQPGRLVDARPLVAGRALLRRAGFLRGFPRMPQAPVESCEALEQLRVLWHGHRIAVHVSAVAPGPGVDTPQDLERVRALFAQGG